MTDRRRSVIPEGYLTDRERAEESRLALLAVLARKGRVSLAPEDLDAAVELELVVSEAPFGDPPGSKILEARTLVDPRRARIRAGLVAEGATFALTADTVDRLIDAIIEELDRA